MQSKEKPVPRAFPISLREGKIFEMLVLEKLNATHLRSRGMQFACQYNEK